MGRQTDEQRVEVETVETEDGGEVRETAGGTCMSGLGGNLLGRARGFKVCLCKNLLLFLGQGYHLPPARP